MVTVSQEEQEQVLGPTVPEEHGARLAPEQKGGSGGFDPPRASDPSAQKEDTRSLSMVQES